MKDAPDHALFVMQGRVSVGAKISYFSSDDFESTDALVLEFRVVRKGPNGWKQSPGEPLEEIMLLVPHDVALAITSEIVAAVPPGVYETHEAEDP